MSTCGLCLLRPCTLLCFCLVPRAQLCSQCAVQHFLKTDLKHSPLPYYSEKTQFPCSICHSAEALILCKCSNPWGCYCEDCFQGHCKTKGAVHETHPAAAKDFLEHDRPMEEFFERQHVIDCIQSGLRANLRQVVLCRAEIAQLAGDLIRLTEAWRSDCEAALSELSSSLEALIEESIRRLRPYRSQWQIDVHTKLEQILFKNCFADDALHSLHEDLKLFSWDFTPDAITSSLASAFTVKQSVSILSPVKNIYYVVPWASKVLGYFLPCTVPTRHSLLMQGKFKSFCAWCEAGPNRLMVSGGYKHTSVQDLFFKDVKLVNMSLHIVTALPSLTTERCRHSLLFLNGHFFAIGGFNGSSLASIEKYEGKREEWIEVATLSEGKDCASTAVWRDKVYIIGFASRKIELFDPVNDRVGLFSIKLNSLFDFFLGPKFVTVLGVANDELIVLMEEEMLKVELVSGKTESTKLQKQLDKTWFSQCPPVMVGSHCYFFNLDQEFWTLELTHGVLEYIAKLVI